MSSVVRWILIVLAIIVLVVLMVWLLYMSWRRREQAPTGDLKGLKPLSEIRWSDYSGLWYEIGRMDSTFEPANMKDVTAHYKPQDDGTLRVVNVGVVDGDTRVAKGFAWKTPTPSTLQVSFFPFTSGQYVILDAQESTPGSGQYEKVVIGSPDRNYLWSLSRTPQPDPLLLSHTIQIAAHNGYCEKQLRKFHSVEQTIH